MYMHVLIIGRKYFLFFQFFKKSGSENFLDLEPGYSNVSP